jgi:hypothetical protein
LGEPLEFASQHLFRGFRFARSLQLVSQFGNLGSATNLTGHMKPRGVRDMGGLIYLVGLIVIVMAILSFFGLR